MFGATYYSPNKIVKNFPGDFILGSLPHTYPDNFEKIKKIFEVVAPVKEVANIRGVKYLKIFINLNNCIPALLGQSMQEVFLDKDISRLAILLNKEAYNVVTKSGITLESLPAYPKERISGLVTMPVEEAVYLFEQIMTNLSKEPLFGSILQSIKRGKKSEINYINGQIVTLAKEHSLIAPLNEKVVAMVHEVENSGSFFTREEVLRELFGDK
jgi:2-dehydropantoate 2-reductase